MTAASSCESERYNVAAVQWAGVSAVTGNSSARKKFRGPAE